MTGQWTLLFLPLLGGAVLMFGLATIVLKNGQTRGAKPLGGLLIATGFFNVFYVLQLWTETPLGSLFWAQLQMPAWTSAAVFAVILTLEYTNRDAWIRPSRVGALFVFPAVATALFFLQTELFFTNVRLHNELSLVVMAADKQLAWWLTVSYAYGLILVSVALLGLQFIRSVRVGHYRGQTLTLIAAFTVPVLANLLQNLLGYQLAFASLGFTLMGIIVYLTVFRFDFLNSVPVARRKILAEMADGFLVVDSQHQIIDANQSVRELFGDNPVIGKSIDEVYPEFKSVVRTQRDAPSRHEYQHGDGETDRFFDVQISPVSGIGDRIDARIVRFTDITESKERERELKRQNERLERFANVVSHDLRNPLNVANGRLELAGEECDSEHLDSASQALSRMETLIEDVLALTRHGRPAGDMEDVEIAEMVQQCWSNVETDQATLTTETDQTIRADKSRLQQLLENLIRNAVDHGGEEATVTVGRLADGFYIEDDGPGIDEEDRGKIFEAGYSTMDGGTGFGLSIVKEIAEAHGWEIEVLESHAGGTRFEFNGVDVVD